MKFLYSLLLLFVFSVAFAQQRTMNQEVFDSVVKEISVNHFDAQFSQKYAKIITEYREKALKSGNIQELGNTIDKFLSCLPYSHLAIILPSDVSVDTSSFDYLQVPVKLIESDGKVLVYEAFPGSNFRKGDEVIALNNDPCTKNTREPRVFQLKDILRCNRPDWDMPVEVLRNGKKIKFHHRTKRSDEAPRFFDLGHIVLPEDYHSKFLSPECAYVSFLSFTPFALQSLKKDIRTKFKDVPKLVIDLRVNLGGLAIIAPSMGAFLSSKRIDFGTMTPQGMPEQRLKSYPQKERYKGKVFILIGPGSASTAEIFAQGMKEFDAATVIGEQSSGKCLPCTVINLSYGFKLQTVLADYVSNKGYRIEGKGVEPHKVIKLSPESLKKNRDNLLDWVLSR